MSCGWNHAVYIYICCYLVTKLFLTLCDCMDCHTPGFPVLHHLLELAKIHVYWVNDAIQPSHILPAFPCLPSFLALGSFPKSQLFASGGQSIGASASASVLPVNIQDWFPLGLTGLIFFLSKWLIRVFSSTTIWNHQLFGAQPSLWSTSLAIQISIHGMIACFLGLNNIPLPGCIIVNLLTYWRTSWLLPSFGNYE